MRRSRSSPGWLLRHVHRGDRQRVGVSQPYLFRLFPDKRAMFLAAAQRCMEDTIRAFEEAAKGLEGEGALHAMANAYTKSVAEHRSNC